MIGTYESNLSPRDKWKYYWMDKGYGTGGGNLPVPLYPDDTCGGFHCTKCGVTGWWTFQKGTTPVCPKCNIPATPNY